MPPVKANEECSAMSLIDCAALRFRNLVFPVKGACKFYSTARTEVRPNGRLMACPGNAINYANLKFLMLNDPTWRY